MTDEPVGTKAFFDDLDEYRFDKLRYLPQLVDFASFRGQRLLEVGCGIGTDLLRFPRGGGRISRSDRAKTSFGLGEENFALHGERPGELGVANDEALPYADAAFDVVYGHGVIQYTANPARLVTECARVLRPGGTGIFMV